MPPRPINAKEDRHFEGNNWNLTPRHYGAARVDRAALHIGAVAVIHRFGSSLNAHVHFHVCVVDGVFEEVAGDVDVIADVQPTPPSVIFHPASGVDETTVAQVQADLRRRILRAFVGRGLLESLEAKGTAGQCCPNPARARRASATQALTGALTRPHRCGLAAPEHCAGAWPAAVAGR